VPCSIAYAERIFAGYTNVVEGRERLGADHAEELLQIQYFIHQPDYDFNKLSAAMFKEITVDEEEKGDSH